MSTLAENVFVENRQILRIEIDKSAVRRIVSNFDSGFGYKDNEDYISSTKLNELRSKDLISNSFYHEIEKSLDDLLNSHNNSEYIDKKINQLTEKYNLYCTFSKYNVSSLICFEEHIQNIFIINGDYIKSDRRKRYIIMVTFYISGMPFNCEYNNRFGEGVLFEKRSEKKIGDFFSQSRQAFLNKIKSRKINSGIYPVVLKSGTGGIIFHEAIGHLYELNDFEYYRENIGRKVCSSEISVVDNGTIEKAFGSSKIDDDGIETRKNYLIKNGKVRNFLISKENSKEYNLKPTGNGRRESYKYNSASRMTNTYLDNGEVSVSEIIRNISNGIYASTISCGTVNRKDNLYSFDVEEGYLVRNGQVMYPLNNIIISGKIDELLKNVKAIGNDLDFQIGGCVGESGIIPISVGSPTVLVDNLFVSNKVL